jgi:hypothetical protein
MNALARLRLGPRNLGVIAIAAGVAFGGSMVYTASNAAFTATTDNANNNWNSGSVVLSDDALGAARFTVNNMIPNVGGGGTTLTGNKCIVVTYSGATPVDVKFRVGASSNPDTNDTVVTSGSKLGDYINLKVEEGGGTATFANSGNGCSTAGEFTADTAGPGSDGVLFNGTMTTFVNTHTTFANAAPASGTTWHPTGSATKVYKLTWDATSLPDRAGVMAKAFTCTFVWEAKSA